MFGTDWALDGHLKSPKKRAEADLSEFGSIMKSWIWGKCESGSEQIAVKVRDKKENMM